jgi:hypothetical protein
LGSVLAIVFINPFTEGVEFTSPLVFMFSHYALFAAGLILGYTLFSVERRVWVIGAIVAVIWHIPQPFALSAGLQSFRAIEEATMILGGLLMGSNIKTMRQITKLTLTVLWLVGDTTLSVLFIGKPTLYSHSSIAYSPYQPSGFPITGVAMVLWMNAVLIYLVYTYVRRVNATIVKAHGA